MNRKKWIIGIVIILIIIAAIVISRGNKPVTVTAVSPTENTLVVSLTASAEVKAARDADLLFTMSGTLASLPVEEGQYVAQGEVLAAINSTEAWQTLQSAVLAKEKAIAAADEIRETYGEDITHGVGFYRLRQANKAAEQADATIAIYQQQLANQSLSAPFDGIILDTDKHPGEQVRVTDASPLVKVADLSSLFVEIEIDEDDIGKVELGQPVNITLDAYDDKVFGATITNINRYVSFDTGGSKVIIADAMFTEKDQQALIIGLSGDAEIIQEEVVEALTIPLDSVLFDGEDAYVFIIENDKAMRRDITLGKENEEEVQVISGLTSSDIIVLDTSDELTDGKSVTVER